MHDISNNLTQPNQRWVHCSVCGTLRQALPLCKPTVAGASAASGEALISKTKTLLPPCPAS